MAPQDAEDASQEILIKVVTGLSSFRGGAAVSTWVHRIAVNAVFHSVPLYRAPDRLASGVTRLLSSQRWSILEKSSTGR